MIDLININYMSHTIDEYKILKKLGEGGFAKVKLVKEIKTDKIFAMKILKSNSETHKSLLQKEYNILKTLDHPNIVQFHDF